jgi:drug/metabolite transporter (DMT)-like permease
MEKHTGNRGRAAAWALLTLAVLSWAVNTVLARGLVSSVNPMTLSFFRWLIALAVILPFGWPRLLAEKGTLRRHWPRLLVFALLGVAAYNILIYSGAHHTTATNMSFVIAGTPAITFVLSRIILGEKAGTVKTWGMLTALAGMMVIVLRGDPRVLLSLDFNAGDALTLAAVVSWAVYSVLFRRFSVDMDPVAFLTAIILLGLPFILPLYLWERAVLGGLVLSAETAAALLFLGVFPSIVSYLCWNQGIRLSSPNTAAVFMYLIPVISSAVAWLFLGETLHGYHLAGGALILFGLVLAVQRG